MSWFHRLVGSLRKDRLEDQLDDELQFHIEMRTQEFIAEGMEPEDARHRARRLFGNQLLLKETTRDVDTIGWIGFILQDSRYALRMLRRNPSFSVAAIFTMALGIGANTAIFSVVNVALVRPLPYPEPERLISLSDTVQGMKNWPSTYLNYLDWKRQNRVFENLAAYQGDSFNVDHGDGVEHVRAWNVSAEFFRTLGVRPFLGRDFLPEDDRPGATPVVELSYGMWQRWFAGDSGVIGRTLSVSGRSFVIAGILPKSFRFYEAAGLYTPLGLSANEMQGRSSHNVRVIGRLKPGVSLSQARADMITIADNLAQVYPAANTGTSVEVTGLQSYVVQDTRRGLLVLMGAVVFLLLIACVNVANLLLARGAAREREMAMRAALGAKWSRVIRQLLTESVVLSLIAAALAIPFCLWGCGALSRLLPEDRRELLGVVIDSRVLAITFLCSLLTGTLFGFAPAIHASRLNLTEALKKGGKSLTAQAHGKFRGLLMVSEIALALMLLTGAGLMLRSLHSLVAVNPGFDPSHLLTMHVALSETTYESAAKQSTFVDQALHKIAAVPGVKGATAATWLPFGWEAWLDAIYVPGQPTTDSERLPQIHYDIVSPGFFHALRIPLVEGRYFLESDDANAPRVAIINQAMARRFWPNDDPVNKSFTQGRAINHPKLLTVVGVVGDTKIEGLDEQNTPQFYLPFAQDPHGYLTFAIRTAGDPLALAEVIRKDLATIDRNQAPYAISSMQEVMSDSLSARQLLMLLLAAFAVLAIVLAAVGVYGVTFYLTSRRTQEIGIRMVLGADRPTVLRLVLRRGVALIVLGLIAGVAASLFVTRFLTGFLYGVGPTDLATLAITSLGVFLVAFVAAAIPAYRLTKIDPLAALRYE